MLDSILGHEEDDDHKENQRDTYATVTTGPTTVTDNQPAYWYGYCKEQKQAWRIVVGNPTHHNEYITIVKGLNDAQETDGVDAT